MSRLVRRSPPSWRVPDGRAVRPELWLLAACVVGMLLVEVWESARMAEISLGLDQSRAALQQSRTRLDYLRSEQERLTTRAELAPLATQLGLAPPGVHQVVVLPAEYLADGSDALGAARPSWTDRVARIFVSEARARSRSGS